MAHQEFQYGQPEQNLPCLPHLLGSQKAIEAAYHSGYNLASFSLVLSP
jgi:hypothetical protein